MTDHPAKWSRKDMHKHQRKRRHASERAAVTAYNVHGVGAAIAALGAGSADDWPQDGAEHDNGPHGAKNGGAGA